MSENIREVENKIQNVFGQYGVMLKGKVKIFSELEDAQEALAAAEEAEKNYIEAGKFAEAAGFEAGSKGHSGKVNVIVAYLEWVEAGRPECADEEVEEEEEVEDASSF